MHLLPCTIQCTCRDRDNKDCKHPAKVDEFFEPVIRKGCAEEGENETLGDIYTGSFRGRPLKGVLVKVPDGYVGQILKKNCNGRAAFPEEVILYKPFPIPFLPLSLIVVIFNTPTLLFRQLIIA